MNKTSIEWTDFTWNPIRARRKDGKAATKTRDSGTFCTRISPGCTNCYASVINTRFGTGLEYTVPNLAEHEFYIDGYILAEPLKRKKPARIFVADMFDLFHEAIPDQMIAQVFRVMCETAHRHTFQVLTKRADRMRDFLLGWNSLTRDFGPLWPYMWPRKNIWLGVSVEDQQRADERIPLLVQTPATVRFLSVEPQLEEINVTPWVHRLNDGPCDRCIHWVICGGESGPGARKFRREWAESLRKQCKLAGVPFFMKQFGSYPVLDPRYDQTLSGASRKLRDRKGGDMEEWPSELRVREFPAEDRA